MLRCITAWAALAALGLAGFGCSSAYNLATALPLEATVEAKHFPEVEIVTLEGEVLLGKLARLEPGPKAIFLPKPYWGVEMRILAFDDIQTLRPTVRTSGFGRGVLYGVGIVGALAGAGFLASSKYDVDFRAGLAGAPLAGLLAGAPLGALIGGLSSARGPAVYSFGRMTEAQQVAAMKKLMGI